jgi:magnesium-transporting ATPase (P-type)
VNAGLTSAEAARRLAERPQMRQATSRSYASIIRANVFTVFNLILLVAGTATLVFGEWQDALFLGVLVGNAGIGTAQEIRAKRALDRLSALVAPCGVPKTRSCLQIRRFSELGPSLRTPHLSSCAPRHARRRQPRATGREE